VRWLRPSCRTPTMRGVLTALCVLFGLAFVIAVLTGALPEPTWEPLTGPTIG
jgi:hypothetical protein